MQRTVANFRAWAFAVGDLAFLLMVASASSVVMHVAHNLTAHFWLAATAGMVAAMTIQCLMALAVSPLLGSIESMVPSMVVGMAAPMAVCTAHLAGHPRLEASLLGGAAVGAAFHVYVLLHARKCRRYLNPNA